MRRRIAPSAVAMVLGLVLIVVAFTQLHRDRPTPSRFAVARDVAATLTPSPTSSAPRTDFRVHDRGNVRAPAQSDEPTTRIPLTASAIAPIGTPAVPVMLSLPSLNVRAAVRQVVTTNQTLGVPDNIADVGWWSESARPGSTIGSIVIDGHVDSTKTGAGALFHLAQLQPGDPVTVTDAAGVLWQYRVYQRQVFVKHDGLSPDLFSITGAPRLVIITCGGPFDRATRNYMDNIVVLATPAS